MVRQMFYRWYWVFNKNIVYKKDFISDYLLENKISYSISIFYKVSTLNSFVFSCF